jgi:hypothetical protein
MRTKQHLEFIREQALNSYAPITELFELWKVSDEDYLAE